MSFSDPIADLITRIRNAQRIGKSAVKCPASKLKMNVLEVLKKEGYIEDFSQDESAPSKKEIEVKLRYVEGRPVIQEIDRISKPGRRIYTSVKQMPKVRSGLGIYVVSTNQGIMSDHAARERQVGGEILFKVF